MKFKSMSLQLVPRDEGSKIKDGIIEVIFENRTDLDTFLLQMKNIEVNGVVDEEFDAYILKGEENELKAYINLPLEKMNFRQAEKDAVLAYIQKMYPEAYDYTKFTANAKAKSPSRPIPLLPKALKDYFAHLYRAPSRHTGVMSLVDAALVGVGLSFTGVGLFVAAGAALLSGFATTVGLNVRRKYYGSYKPSQSAKSNVFHEVFEHGIRAGDSWKPYLTSFVNYKDYLHHRSFGKGMVARMDLLDNAEKTKRDRASLH